MYEQDCLSLCFSDDKAESRSSSGPPAAGGGFCGHVAEECHEPGDGRAGERALGVTVHPHHPRPVSVGEIKEFTCRFSHFQWSVSISNDADEVVLMHLIRVLPTSPTRSFLFLSAPLYSDQPKQTIATAERNNVDHSRHSTDALTQSPIPLRC